MNRRFFMNGAQPQGFPFIFGHPYFQTANLNDYDQVYEIPDPEVDDMKANLIQESANEEKDIREQFRGDENLANSLSSERLRIDPNYKWLLKDLNLSNETRFIDVTDILEDKKDQSNDNLENDEDKKLANNDAVDQEADEGDDPVKLFYPNNDQLITHTSLNNTSRDLDDLTINTNNSEIKPEEEFEEYDEDHKNDENCITRLYEKLIKPSYDSDKQNETIENHESDYENRPETSLNESKDNSEIESENDDRIKPKANFGKSFEASLSSMDNLIDRIDNGMKLKRNKDKPKNVNEKKSSASEDSNKIVESLKQEWSNMFSKLEHDYKSKLDEQQKLNDMKLKSLHDEIKKCIIEQEKFINKVPNSNNEKEASKNNDKNLPSTLTISDYSKSTNKVDASTTTADTINPTSINDNAKYISNLRTELKSKHARHIQDLKDYYEREVEELKQKLDLYVTKYGNDPNDESEKLKENEFRIKYEQLCEINADLKDSNATLIHKLEECNEHISYLKQENYELNSNLGQMNSKLKYAEERIQSLQDGYAGLESQLSESIQLQDKYVRELQTEKRNLMKKAQENEDYQMNIKYYEQKCESYELKLDERDTIITRLKAKLVQTETDFNRLEFEYQKLKNNSIKNTSNLNLTNQQPYIASNASKEANTPLQLPIKTQNRFSTQSAAENLNQLSQVLISPRKQSPARNSNNHQLTVLCNVNTPNNNQYSSSSSSSKSPGPPRSRSPSVNKHEFQENKVSNESSKANQTPQEGLIRFQNHLNPHHKIENENLAAAHSSYQAFNRLSNKFNPNHSPIQQQAQSQGLNQSHFKISELSPEKQIKYIDKLEKEFDFLMKQRQQLDAKLTRLPYKATNPSMHTIRENIEEELSVVEKKIASVKLELRKLNIIKTH